METQFQQRLAVITGGTAGIGLASAEQLAQTGCRVVISGRSVERGNAAVEQLRKFGRDVTFIPADMSSEADVRSLFREIESRYGNIDFLFNNAGIEGGLVPPLEWSETDVDELLSINVKGVYLAYKYAVPLMLKRGKGIVINTASFVGTVVPVPDAVIYGATKAAVISITRTFAAGFSDKGILSYAVCPWVTDTPMVDRLTGYAGIEAREGFARMLNPSGTLVTPGNLAKVVFQLFAGDHDYHSGDCVLVDAGGKTELTKPFS